MTAAMAGPPRQRPRRCGAVDEPSIQRQDPRKRTRQDASGPGKWTGTRG